MKAAGVTAGAIAFGGTGLTAFAGSAAAATASMTVRSGTSSTVVGYRAGDEAGAFPTSIPNVSADLTWVHPAWSGTSHDFDDESRWIWHADEANPSGQTTADVSEYNTTDSDPTYYVRKPVVGDVAEFEETFTIPGSPQSGTLYITADNGYEVWVNGTHVGSATVQDGVSTDWEDSDLSHAFVPAVAGTWDDVEDWDVSSLLTAGSNTLRVRGANEQMSPDDVDASGNPEAVGTVTSNPGGVIYELDLTYEACLECAFDGTAKFEYVYEEEDGVVVTDGFVLEDGEGFDDIVFDDYDSKDDEDGEPGTVYFDSDICADDLLAWVKAGPMEGWVDVTTSNGSLVVSIVGNEAFENNRNGRLYAISYIAFSCP